MDGLPRDRHYLLRRGQRFGGRDLLAFYGVEILRLVVGLALSTHNFQPPSDLARVERLLDPYRVLAVLPNPASKNTLVVGDKVAGRASYRSQQGKPENPHPAPQAD